MLLGIISLNLCNLWFLSNLKSGSPRRTVTGTSIQNWAGARGTCGKLSGFLAVEGSGSAGVAEGNSDKWHQVFAASPAVLELVGFPAESHTHSNFSSVL